jgi:hypothetical protein
MFATRSLDHLFSDCDKGKKGRATPNVAPKKGLGITRLHRKRDGLGQNPVLRCDGKPNAKGKNVGELV